MMRELLWNLVSGGLPRDYDLEAVRKMLLINLIVLLGCVFLLIFTVAAYFQHEYILSAVDLAVVLFLLVVVRYLRKTKDYDRVGAIGVVAIGCFYSFLIGHGGVSSSAYMWAFTYPMISLFLTGAVWGSITTLSMLGVACVLFALGPSVPIINEYDGNVIARFVAAYSAVYLFALVMERVRAMVQSRLGDANRKLEESVEQLGKANEEKRTLIYDLKRTMDEVSTLKGILPICANCKNIRDDSGYWQQVEEYVRDRSDAEFSHSICPDCMKELYPGMQIKS